MQTSTASAVSVVLAPLVTSRHISENLYPPHVHHTLKLALQLPTSVPLLGQPIRPPQVSSSSHSYAYVTGTMILRNGGAHRLSVSSRTVVTSVPSCMQPPTLSFFAKLCSVCSTLLAPTLPNGLLSNRYPACHWYSAAYACHSSVNTLDC